MHTATGAKKLEKCLVLLGLLWCMHTVIGAKIAEHYSVPRVHLLCMHTGSDAGLLELSSHPCSVGSVPRVPLLVCIQAMTPYLHVRPVVPLLSA